MAGEDPRVTIRLPPKLLEKLRDEVGTRGLRWDQRGEIILLALSDYFRKQDPIVRREEIILALQEDPKALKEIILQTLSDLADKK